MLESADDVKQILCSKRDEKNLHNATAYLNQASQSFSAGSMKLCTIAVIHSIGSSVLAAMQRPALHEKISLQNCCVYFDLPSQTRS